MKIYRILFLLISILLCISGSLFITTFAQEGGYAPLPPMPPTKRIPFTWNLRECWTCHYIPAPMAPETFEMRYLPKLIYQLPHPYGKDFPVMAESGLWRITTGSGNNTEAVWSPDGRKMIYTSDRFGNWTLNVMDIDSLNEIQLTSPEYVSGWADWSPDGERIAFWSYRNNESQIFTIKPDGTDEQQLTHGPLLKSEPLWSPNGDMMLFGQLDEYWEIWILDLETGTKWQVSSGEYNHWAPYWMPDGKEILYYSSDGLILKSVEVSGENDRDLTFASVDSLPADLLPKVSPDETKILFNSLRSPNWGLWLMDIDGENPIRLTQDGAGDRTPSWSPDGKWILYSSYRTGNPDIWLMDSNGNNQNRLTKGGLNDFSPTWNPKKDIIAFESDRLGKFDIWILQLHTNLEARINYPEFSYQNSSTKAELEIETKIEETIQIETVKLRFDWQTPDSYHVINFDPPLMISSPLKKENHTITFEIPKDIAVGYHLYDLIIEYQQIKSNTNPMKIYQHTAKDLLVASEERRIYEMTYEKVTSRINIENEKAEQEGYSESLLEANQELYTAETLAQTNKLTEATEHLNLAYELLEKDQLESETLQFPTQTIVYTILVILLIALAYIVLKRR